MYVFSSVISFAGVCAKAAIALSWALCCKLLVSTFSNGSAIIVSKALYCRIFSFSGPAVSLVQPRLLLAAVVFHRSTTVEQSGPVLAAGRGALLCRRSWSQNTCYSG